MGPFSFGGGPGPGGGAGGMGGFRVEDLGDLFGGLFGGGRWRRRRLGRGGPRGGAAGRRSRDRAAPVVPRRGARRHHVGASHVRCLLSHLRRHRRRTRDGAGDLRHVSGNRSGLRQPGHVRIQPALLDLWWSRPTDRIAVRHLPRFGTRAATTRGQGPDPRRGRGRSAHPTEGSGRPGSRWSGRRPLRRVSGGAPPGLRSIRQPSHRHGSHHLPRGRAGRHHPRAHARRRHRRHQGAGRDVLGSGVPAARARESNRRREAATCWPRSRSPSRWT